MIEGNGCNYKSDLQHYCHQQKLAVPTYTSVQEGPSNAPSWMVTVRWSDSEYTTPNPIQGSKKHAEHMAAKQVMESLDNKNQQVVNQTEAKELLDVVDQELQASSQTEINAMPSAVSASKPDTASEEKQPLFVPVELITTALGIANHRLSQFKRERRYVGALGSEANFPEQLAKLSMEIVKAVHREAEAQHIEIEDVEIKEEQSD